MAALCVLGLGATYSRNGGDGMKRIPRSIFLFFSITILLFACSGGGGGGGAGGGTGNPDTTPPMVIFSSPNGAVGVSINSSPSATFNEPMDVSTINQSTFTLKDNSGIPVSGTVESSSQAAIFHPAAVLAYSTTYIATITTGVKDAAGNAPSSNTTWTFTTEAAPPAPPTGFTAVPGDGKVTLSWNLASDLTTSYCLYWSTSPGVTKNSGNKIALGQLVQNYLHENLTGGTTYYYVITETLNGTEGAESSEVSATPPYSTSITRYAANGSFAWQRGVNGNVAGVAMAGLPDGSFYVTGNFSCTATFGIGELNETTLTQPSCATSAWGPNEMFLARYNADGSLDWARQTQSSVVREPKGVTVLSDGSVIIVGSYAGDITFDQTTLASTSWSDVFVVRYAGNGSLLWAKRAVVGGYLAAGDEARSVVALSDDSVVLTGSFFENITFSPGDPGSMTLNTVASCNTNDFDIFIARYSKDGALLWARRAGGCSWEEGLSIAALPGDKTAITGRFRGSVTFGPDEANQTILTSASTTVQSYDMFLASYESTTGNLQWARSAQSTDVDDVGSGICTTAINSLAVTGSLGGITTFGTGEPNQTILSNASAFIAQYNVANGTLAWVAGMGGDIVPNAVAASPLGAATVAGTVYTAATLGGTMVTTPYTDILLVRYSANGSLAWVKRVDRGPSSGRYVSVLSDGSTLVLGNKVHQ